MSPLESLLARDRLLVVASIVGLTLLSWLFLIHLALQMETMDGVAARMMGMQVEDALRTRLATALDPGAAALADAAVNFALVTLMWAVMMVGMMVPSAAPTILLFAALERKRKSTAGNVGRTAAFMAGYLVIWSAFSVAAAAMQTALAQTDLVSMHMATTSTALAGTIFIAAGLYELSPIKDRCLTHCRSPFDWIPRHMRQGRIGALRMGMEHGAYCVGCCWVLMLLLFVGGVMNLVWVAVLAAIVLLQKLLPGGLLVARLTSATLVVCGVILFVLPSLLT